MKEIAFTAPARRQFRALPQDIQAQIRAKLARYAETGAGDVTALQGVAGFRLRHRDYRAIFVETETALEIRAVGHRRDIYR
ncbi:type II toxin-antitoxin system RelE/ParE family toxin [Phenylobacterium sp.]|uniref:type II toxin-antitoxin system RelE family toxin n=1 Tax=Phenylobacterium sp. TaxID=1871053 RepID=UPI0035B0ADCD